MSPARESSIGFRSVLGALGFLVVVGGIVVLVEPSVAADAPVGYGVVTAIGIALVALGIRYGLSLMLTRIEAATPPVVERRRTVSIPGLSFDRVITDREVASVSRLRRRRAVIDRLRSLAERVLGADDPGGRLRNGTWTDDPDAASVFAESDDAAGFRERVAARAAGETIFQRRVASTIAEIARLHDGERGTVTLESPAEDHSVSPSNSGERLTNRWRLLKPMALVAVGVGVVVGSAGLLLVGTLFGGFAVYAAAGGRPTGDVRIERTIDPADPLPGEPVQVTLEVENDGDQFVPDLRVVDRVPDDVSVIEGSPRHGTALRPGATATFGYRVEAVRGSHAFGDAYLIARNLSGTIERVTDASVEGDDTVTYDVRDAVDQSVPLRKQTSRSVGRIVTDVGGSGLEFHAVREYRTGDPLARIDWNRAAGGGDLATLQFREERSATVVILIDARQDAYVAPETDAPSAVDRSVLAAAQCVPALLGSDDRVGLAALSPRQCWLQPGGGQSHLARAHELLATHEAFGPMPPDREFLPTIRLSTIRKRLPADAQLLVFSPVCDDDVVDIVRKLQAGGHPATLISPDATAGRTPGRTLARIERELRLSTLRDADVRVIDWEPDEPLALALERGHRRWSG